MLVVRNLHEHICGAGFLTTACIRRSKPAKNIQPRRMYGSEDIVQCFCGKKKTAAVHVKMTVINSEKMCFK